MTGNRSKNHGSCKNGPQSVLGNGRCGGIVGVFRVRLMCLAPGILPDGQKIACRKCWQCIENRVDDWVGRCIAESKTARACHAITLTYGRDENDSEDHPRARVLTYSDVQKYWKKLRIDGFGVRYFAVGEYGSAKGRAHWHIVVFWENDVPEHVLDRNFSEDHWEHGFSFWTKPTPAAIRYNCKYIMKDMGKEGRQGHLMMSKKPPLGSEYFKRQAERWVENGLAPQDLIYTFDEARTKEGQKTQFMLRGKTADIFLGHYLDTWAQRRPGRPLPESELLENWLDKNCGFDLYEMLQQEAWDARYGAVIEQALREAEWRKSGSIGGIWNSAKYRSLDNGKA